MKLIQELFRDTANILLGCVYLAAWIALGLLPTFCSYSLFQGLPHEGAGELGAFFYFIAGIVVFREVDFNTFWKDIGIALFSWILSVIVAFVAVQLIPDYFWGGLLVGSLFYGVVGPILIESKRVYNRETQVTKGIVERSYEELRQQKVTDLPPPDSAERSPSSQPLPSIFSED